MSERIKSLAEQKIEKSLGITNANKNTVPIVNQNGAPSANKDDDDNDDMTDEDRIAIELRKEQAKKLQEKLGELKKLDDKEFSREMYRELAMDSFTLMRIVKNETEIVPSPRYIEVASQMATTTSSILDSLRDIETTDKKMDLEVKKIEMKEKGSGQNTTNIVFSGNLQELLKQSKKELLEEHKKIIDVKVEEI